MGIKFHSSFIRAAVRKRIVHDRRQVTRTAQRFILSANASPSRVAPDKRLYKKTRAVRQPGPWKIALHSGTHVAQIFTRVNVAYAHVCRTTLRVA